MRITPSEEPSEERWDCLMNVMMQPLPKSTLTRDIGLATIATISVAAASIIGQFATYPNLLPWYSALAKPRFNPPNWVFAPVWTGLYLVMAFALWRVLRLPETSAGRRLAIALFFIPLALNAAWSWMFLGQKSSSRYDQHRPPVAHYSSDHHGFRSDR